MTATTRVAAEPASAVADDTTAIRLSRDEPERFAAIFDTYFAEIHRYVARRLGPNVAEDVVAETFLAAFRKRERYDAARGSVRTWLYGIATNCVGKHRRAEVRALRALTRVKVDAGEEAHADQVAARVSAEALQAKLAAALARLRPGDRDVLLLVTIGGLSHEETAAALAIPYGTVGSRLSRARRKLREALGDADPTLDHPTLDQEERNRG